MSNVPKIISLFFLIVSLHSFGQYKRMSIGAEYGFTYISKYNYNFNLFSLSGLSVQYNFKKLFSVKSGFLFEKYDFHQHFSNVSGTIYSEHNIDVDARFINIPLLLKGTIVGEFVSFYVNTGINSSISLKSHYYDDMLLFNPSLEFAKESGEITADRKVNVTFAFGAGLSSTIKKRLTIYTEIRGMLRNAPVKNPPLYSFHNYYGVVLISGIAYQFNFSKKSDYVFSSYKIGIGKHTL